MITAGGVIAGLMLMGLGFVMLWRARWFREYVGNLGELLQVPKLDWLDWSMVGVFLLVIGFIVILGLFQSLLGFVFSPFIRPSIQ